MKSRQWMQIAAVASAMGLAGGALANDVNDATQAPDTPAVTQSNDTGSNPAADLGTNADVNGGAGLDNPTKAGSSSDVNGQVERNATQGSTMTSPKPNSAVDTNAPAGAVQSGASERGKQDRFANGNSDNFNSWMSDYASQHDGRISRDEFMSQMQRRWDERDTQQRGLTPYEVEEIFVFTPADNGTASEGNRDVQPGATEQGGATQ